MQEFTRTVARTSGIAFGLATHALFAVTVWHLVWFLAGHGPGTTTTSETAATAFRSLAIDAALAALFAVPHSVLLLPAVRRSLTARLVPPAFYGCFYCVVTCVALLTTIAAWQRGASWTQVHANRAIPRGERRIATWPRPSSRSGFVAPASTHSASLSGMDCTCGTAPERTMIRRSVST